MSKGFELYVFSKPEFVSRPCPAAQSRRSSREHLPFSVRTLIDQLFHERKADAAKFDTLFLECPQSTTLIVSKKLRGLIHKYVMGELPCGHEFFIALPVEWVQSHKQIVQALERTAGNVFCSGGGFLLRAPDPIVYGLSCEYGKGAHERALQAFQNARPR